MLLSMGMSAEEQLWEGAPSLKALSFDAAAAVLFCLLVAVVVFVGYSPVMAAVSGLSKDVAHAVARNDSTLRLAAVLLVVIVGGVRIFRLAMRGLALRSQKYRLSNQRLLVETGLLSRTIDEIDLRTVEDITFHQSFGERLFGLGQIGIVSSEPMGASAMSAGFARAGRLRARLVGVENARAVREQIRNAAYAASGKQIFMRPT
jgi:uncharacterized membrane protein YdbT with pleckstrin-like domain